MALMGRASARPKLVEPMGFDSPARAELALAIAERDHLQKSADMTRGLDRLDWDHPARQILSNAEAAEQAAAQRLEAARQALVDHHHAAMIGEPVGEAPSLWDAQEQLAEARETVAALRPVADGLIAASKAAYAKLAFCNGKIDHCRKAVVREGAAVYALRQSREVQDLQRELASKGALLRWLMSRGAVPVVTEPGHRFGNAADEATEQAVAHSSFNTDYWGALVRANSRTTELWEAAFEALRTDPHAPLPVDQGDKQCG